MADTGIKVPQFNLPFKLSADGVACVEQDSYEDIANCVELIVRTPVGFRDDAPDRGFPQLEFLEQNQLQGILPTQIVTAQEPRADVLLSSKPDAIDALIERVLVDIR